MLDPAKASNRNFATGLVLIVLILFALAGLSPWRFVSFLLAGLAIACAMALVSLNVTRSREAILEESRNLWGLTGVMVDGKVWPPPGGWALAADALTFLLREIPARGLHKVVELGPGTSSIVLGRALPEIEMFGVEHDPTYVRTVGDMIRQHGLAGYTLLHAPLVGEGTRQWYDPAVAATLPHDVDVLIVDGPPNLEGRGNREPAWRALREHLADGALVLVDDTHRRDERAMATGWLSDPELDLEFDGGSFMVLCKGSASVARRS
jgi:predicted O-methyltransferase YrrM